MGKLSCPKTKIQMKVINNPSQACNPYHGDLVLVTVSPKSNDYRFVCKCKFDGYIGNDSLDGPCKTVHICNGKFDNINQPLDKIKCICRPDETNVRYMELVPACKTLTIREANDKYSEWYHMVPFDTNKQYLLATKHTVPEIRQNFNCKYILDPTKHSFHDTTKVHKDNLFYDNHCVARGRGIPVNLGILNPNTTLGPDNKLLYNHVDGDHKACA